MEFSQVKQVGIWDLRPPGLRHPDSIYPPVKCLVVNAQNERVPDVFFVNFGTGVVGRFKTRTNEFGMSVKDVTVEVENGVETRTIAQEWVTIPGVKVVPFPPGYEADMVERCTRAKARYRADAAGKLTETAAEESAMAA